MTTPETSDSPHAAVLALLQLHGPQRLIQDAEPRDPECPSAALPESKGLWTDGLPDPAKIKLRMEALANEFVNKRYQRVTSGHFQFQREIRDRHRAEAEFYGEMHYLEDLLYSYKPAVLSLQPASTTTIVPYTPLPPRRRGRPSTGGRKPKPTTRSARTRSEDTDY